MDPLCHLRGATEEVFRTTAPATFVLSDANASQLLILYRHYMNPTLEKKTPPRNQAKLQFLCVSYVVIRGHKPVLKNKTPGFK